MKRALTATLSTLTSLAPLVSAPLFAANVGQAASQPYGCSIKYSS